MIKIIGLTGSMASGKSEVRKILSNYSRIVTFDCDSIAKKIISNGSIFYNLVHIFGDAVIENGEVSLDVIRQGVKDSKKKSQLEKLVHPMVWDRIYNQAVNRHKLYIVESAIIYDIGWQGRFNRIINVWCSSATLGERLKSKHEDTIELVEDWRKSALIRYIPSDYTISTECTLEVLKYRVYRLYTQMIKEFF